MQDSSGTLTMSIDANFGLVQKNYTSDGHLPKHKDLLFIDQAEVDDFVNDYCQKPEKEAKVVNVIHFSFFAI